MAKLQIELDDKHLDFLKRLANLDDNATCVGDVIRKLIIKEADRKNLKYIHKTDDIIDEPISDSAVNHLMDTIFGGFNSNPFGRFK